MISTGNRGFFYFVEAGGVSILPLCHTVWLPAKLTMPGAGILGSQVLDGLLVARLFCHFITGFCFAARTAGENVEEGKTHRYARSPVGGIGEKTLSFYQSSIELRTSSTPRESSLQIETREVGAI